MTKLIRCLIATACVLPMIAHAAPDGADAAETRFSTSTGDVKREDGTTWSVTVTEVERTPRVSVLRVEHNGRLPSVGSSLFIACSVVKLARERGYRYVAQKDEAGRIRLGFLDRIEDDPAKVLGPAFASMEPGRKYDAEFMAPICDAPQPPPPPADAPLTKGASPAPK